MNTPLLMSEGFHIDSFGNLISTMYVDLRGLEDRAPITVLVKGCLKEHAIERIRKVRISKPSRFWEYGEGLIQDREEGHASETLSEVVIADDPRHLAGAHVINDELNRAGRLLGLRDTITTDSTRRKHTRRRWLNFHKYGWMFCASLEPRDDEEWDRWWQSMQPDYDHVSHIYRPREFARALASMVAEQLGPRGKDDEMTLTFHGDHKIRTMHKQQVVYHGPVIYSDNPYRTISGSPSDFQFMLRSIFVKSMKFRDQREYRFAILSECEPPEEEEIVDLDASPELLGILREELRGSPAQVLPTIVSTEQDASNALPTTREFTSLLDIPESTSVRYAPHSYTDDDHPDDLHKLITEYSGVRALEGAVRAAIDRQEDGDEQNIEIASAAWHAEPIIRDLCSTFSDPIEGILIGEESLIEITLKFPRNGQSSGKIVVGPHGTARVLLRDGKGQRRKWTKTTRWYGELIADDLKEAGLPVRNDP